MKGFAAFGGNGTGYLIRNYLSRVGSDTQMNIWREMKIVFESQDYVPPTWDSFQNFFRLLKRANLVVEDRSEGRNSTAIDTASRDISTSYPKKYFKLNPAMVNSEAWENVYRFLGY